MGSATDNLQSEHGAAVYPFRRFACARSTRASAGGAFLQGQDACASLSARRRAAVMTPMRAWSPTICAGTSPAIRRSWCRTCRAPGSLVAMNHIANVAPKDGTVIGAINAAMTTQPLIKPDSAKFDPRKMNWIGSTLREYHIGVVRENSPVKTIADAQKTRDARCGHRRLDHDLPGDRQRHPRAPSSRWWQGYQGTAQGMLAMERGEVDGVIGITWASIKATQARPCATARSACWRSSASASIPNCRTFRWCWTPPRRRRIRPRCGLSSARKKWAGLGSRRRACRRRPSRSCARLLTTPWPIRNSRPMRPNASSISIRPRGEEIQDVVEDIFKTPPAVVDRVKPFLEGGQ